MPKTYDGIHCPHCGNAVTQTEAPNTTKGAGSTATVFCHTCDIEYEELWAVTLLIEKGVEGEEVAVYSTKD